MAFTLERIFPSNQDLGDTADKGEVATEENFIATIATIGINHVVTGLAVSDPSSGTDISVSAGEAVIGGRFVKVTGTQTLTLTDEVWHRVWFQIDVDSGEVQGLEGANGGLVATSDTSVPSDAVLLAEVRANSGGIAEIQDRRPLNGISVKGSYDTTLTSPGPGNDVVLGFRPKFLITSETGGEVRVTMDGMTPGGFDAGGLGAAEVAPNIQDYGFSIPASPADATGEYVAYA